MSWMPRIALVGGGIGGLTAALALSRAGFEAHIFEQADRLREVGAGIGLSPNALTVLRALGVNEKIRRDGFVPEAIVGRDWTTGRSVYRMPLKDAVDARYGASNVQVHRGDLLAILAATIPASRIRLNSRCVAVESTDRAAVLTFSGGRRQEFDLVVGCDGIGSGVRAALHGADAPRFTGNMCWRALIDAARLPRRLISPDVTNWMGPGGHIVTYYIRAGELVNVVAVRETTNWIEESWSVRAEAAELTAAFPGVHASLRTLLEHASDCVKWGLFDRDPLRTWSKQRITLLGDAAHPMLPFLGQGAAMAIEDAYVLARELARMPDDITAVLRAYEAERLPRTSQAQLAARKQASFLHAGLPISKHAHGVSPPNSEQPASYETEWLYAYDPTGQGR
jgi:salicylate hydroxylase